MNRHAQSHLNAFKSGLTETERVLQRQLAAPAGALLPRPWLRRVARAFTALFAAQTLLAAMPAYAQLTAAPMAPSGQKPLIDAAANGTPIVLIAPPSKAGVSRNQYDQFNVAPKGLILNNSTGNVQTHIGGWITGNLQLGPTPARIILNEVTGANTSQLKGTIEVGGQKADIVIANPNGITCDGCGFLNANRATLATGTAQFGAGGAITGFDVRQGVIHIGPNGLNATEQQQLEFYARGLVIEGEVYSQSLQAVIGANQVVYGTTGNPPQSASQVGTGEAPSFAIDIKALGGMYAGQIYLIATEKGLGVNSVGRSATLAGNMVLSANGDLTLKDTFSSGNAWLTSTGKTTLTGQTLANGSVTIDAPQQLSNSGALQANTLQLNTPSINNSGSISQAAPGQNLTLVLPGGLQNSGQIYTPGDLSVQAGAVGSNGGAAGQLLAGGSLQVAATSLQLVGQQLAANGSITVQAQTLSATDGSINAGGDVNLHAGGRLDVTGTTVSANGQTRLTGSDITLERARIGAMVDVLITGSGAVTANAADISSNSMLGIQASRVDARSAAMRAVATVDVKADGAILLDGSQLAAGQRVVVQGQGISTANATLAADKIFIDAGVGALNNLGGMLQATGSVGVNSTGLNNQGGVIAAIGHVSADAGSGTLTNTSGLVTGQNIIIGGAVNNSGGVISGSNSVTMTTLALNNDAGVIESGTGGISIDTQGNSLTNTHTHTTSATRGLVSQGAITIAAGDIDNQAGYIGANGALFITQSSNINNQGGTLVGVGNSSVTTIGALSNQGGRILSGADLAASAATLNNSNSGTLYAGRDLSVSASAIDNSSTKNGNYTAGLAAGRNSTITAGAINNASGAIVSPGDTAIRATTSLNNSQGQISGNTVAIDTPVLTNTAGRADAQQRMTLRVRQFSADGVLASNGDLDLTLAGDQTNSGTLSANRNLSISTTGSYTNQGRLSAQNNLSLAATDIDNQLGATIDSQVTTLTSSGTVNNAGLINSTAGETTITAAALNNTGRIYGDSIAITATTHNSIGAGGAAIIASRGGDVTINGPLNNTDGAQVLSLGSIQINGSARNDGSTINAMRNVVITGALTNTNAGFATATRTRTEPTAGLYITPSGSTTRYPAADLGWRGDMGGLYVLPSTTYPIAVFGASPISQGMQQSCATGDAAGECTRYFIYGNDDPVWARFGVASPAGVTAPSLPAAGMSCTTSTGGVDAPAQPITTGACGAYWADLGTYQAAVSQSQAQLDAAINSFNVDVNGRIVVDWYETTISGKTITETYVASSTPGQVLAGGDITLAGGTNKDSVIVAAGDIAFGGNNESSDGTTVTTTNGTMVFSHRTWSGGFSRSYGRDVSAPQPIADAPVTDTFKLPILKFKANGSPAAPSPGGTSTPVGGATAVFTNTVTTQPIPAQTVDASDRRSAPMPVKAAGYTTVKPNGAVRAPNSQLFVLNRSPRGPLVETDPAFTGYRNFISSSHFLLQLAMDPERNLKLYGDGFAEQRLIDDQILALTGRRFLSGYSSTEEEFAALMDAGVMYAQQYQLTPGVALSAEQMALLTTDIVWLEAQAVTLPDGGIVQALVPTVYLRRPMAGDLTPSGALISGSNVTLRSPGDLANTGTVFANGDEAAGDGKLTLEGLNVNNSGMLGGNRIAVTAQQTIDNTGGVIQGLGAASSASLNARDIILRTTTQTSVASIQGPNGISTGTRTSVDRIATVTADSVQLAAVNNISLQGATVSAKEDLVMTAGGVITSDSVQTGYTLNIPLGGGGSQGRSSFYNAAATTQQVTTLDGGKSVTIAAIGDANFKGTNVTAGTNLAVQAQNIVIEAAKDSLSIDQQGVNRKGYERVAQADEALTGAIFSAGNNLALIANGSKALNQGNITVTGATVAAGTGQASLIADNNIAIQNATTEHSQLAESYSSSKSFLGKESTQRSDSSQSTEVNGSNIIGNTVLVQAGNDATIRASELNAVNDAQINAGRDVNITTAQESTSASSFLEQKKSGLSASLGQISIGKSAHDQTQALQSTTQVGNTISAANIRVTAGRDATITASAILADRDINVSAGRDINLNAATDTQTTQAQAHSSSTVIGLAPTGLSGRFTQFGRNSASQDGISVNNSQSTSLLSANSGNLTLAAGTDAQYRGTGQGNVTSQGADLLAKEKVGITGNAVDLQAAQFNSTSASHAESKSVTLGSQLTGVIGGAITRVGDMLEEASDTSNSRLQGALLLKSGYDAYKLSQGLEGSTEAGDATSPLEATGSGIGVSASLSAMKSRQDATQSSTINRGTNIQAQTIDIVARDADITATGAKLQAQDISLDAALNVNLRAAQNTTQLQSSNSGSSAGLGATLSFGGAQNGLSFQASASQSKGHANGSETSYDNTLVTATGNLKIKSGADTNLVGAQVAGNTVKMDVGGNLNVETLQDESQYKSRQTSSGFAISVCVPPLCVGAPATGSVSASKQKINHNYQSATGQSGIAAGAGGFDINVAGNTDLKGGAITSEADRNKNTLPTGSLTYSDLNNTQNTDANSSSVSLSSNGYGGAGAALGNNVTNNLMGNLQGNSGLPGSGSQSGVTQSVISPANITIKSGDATSQANAAILTSRDASTANGSLRSTLTLQQAQELESKLKEQQENQRAADLVGAVVTNAIGDLAAENKRAEGSVENKWAEGSTQKLALHGFAGLIQAKVGGGNALAGISAGMAQEALAPVLASYLEANGIPRKLADGKTTNPDFTALMQAGAAMAGAAVGAVAGGTSGAATGASVALTGVTNNFLKHDQAAAMNKRLNDCRAKPGGCSMEESDKIFNEYRQLSNANIARVQACKFLGDSACVNALLSQAASPSEVTSRELSTQQEALLYQRAVNADYTASVTGSKVPGNTDAQQAQRVAQFRQANCAVPNSPECDSLVWKAMTTDQVTALALVGASLGVAPGAALAAATPATAAATMTAIRACAANAVLCVNQAGITAAEILGGDALGGAAVMAGTAKVVKTATTVKAEVTAATRAVTSREMPAPRIFNGIELDPRLPPPAAGYDYSPNFVSGARTDNQAYSHWTAIQGEAKLANEVVGQGQVVIKWGDKIGAKGNDVISVNPSTAEVILWDNKYRSNQANIGQSPTFRDEATRRNAINEARDTIQASDLPPLVKDRALQNLDRGNFTTNTVGDGATRNSVQVRYCGGSPC